MDGALMHLPRVVGVLRRPTPEAALEAARAAIRGGLEALEVTCTIPDAAQVVRVLVAEQRSCVIGAGTVLGADQATDLIQAGCRFLVGPNLEPDVLEVARAAEIAYIPGVLTPNEIARALRLGVEVVKLFPITSVGGVQYLRDIRGPFPTLRCMVTGGVRGDQVQSYLEAGALSVGLGEIFARDIERDTREVLEQLCTT
jgi:2-dehydro-3-deoxyphosphogluconate aldolase/(4S)-4-hydroxy-2-oxoglutarate aldolase